MNLLYRKLGDRRSFDTTRLCLALIAASCVALAASESGLAGPAECGKCHAAQYDKQIRSRHARALRPIRESIWAAPGGGVTDRAFAISYQPQAESVDVLVSGPSGAISAALTWAFGAGAQGLTPVGIENGRYFEHRFSYYSRPNRLARTFGHPARPETAASELGVPQDTKTIFECFNCHSTGAIPGGAAPDLSEMIPGVTCERCHGPGQAHVSAAQTGASADAIRRSIVNPKRFSAKAQIEMCGQCHRLPPPNAYPEPEVEDPITVRFAPMGLMASRCFTKSGKLSCMSCHDPHDDAKPRSDLAAYAGRCLGCHDSRPALVASKCSRAVSRDCVSCHMPAAALGPYLRFTDHRIRVN